MMDAMTQTNASAMGCMPERIVTAAALLRPLVMGDARDVARLAYTDSVAGMTGSLVAPNPALAAEMHVLRLPSLLRRGLMWHYAIDVDGALTGCIAITRRGAGGYEIGYWIGEPFWGRGLASDAVQSLCTAFDGAFPGDDLHAEAYRDNPGSLRVLEKAGFHVVEERDLYGLHRQGTSPGYVFLRPGR